MKTIKRVVTTLSLMLLFCGTCFSQEEFRKDSVWGASVDTTETEMFVHFYFSCKEKSKSNEIRFNYYHNDDKKGGDLFYVYIGEDTVIFNSKYIEITEFTDFGDFYEIRAKTDKWVKIFNFLQIMVNKATILCPINSAQSSSLIDPMTEEEKKFTHRYFLLNGDQLNNPPYNGLFLDCRYSQSGQFMDCKKCMIQ
jgi:hypothetical protein